MNTFKRLVFGLLCALVITVATTSRAQAQTPVPVYVDPQASTFADWQWQCGGYIDYVYIDPFPDPWRPYWYYGADWYWGDWWNGYVPGGYWQPYFYYSCHWVLAAIYDIALIQIADTDFWCTYNVTVTMSDNSTDLRTLSGTGGSADDWIIQGYGDGPSVVSATATKTCVTPPPPITVRLTFDDGPTSAAPHNTRKVLTTLANNVVQSNIPVTFFVQTHVPIRGGHPEGIQTMEMALAAGHDIMIHTGSDEDHVDHRVRVGDLPYAGGANALESDLIRAKARISSLSGGSVPIYVRAPGGATNTAVLQTYASQNLTHKLWDLDSADSSGGATLGSVNLAVINGMHSRLNQGDTDIVILFHDIKSVTADNLATYLWNIRAVA
jgi:peptidoglycan/xylan/chitin deacetylase (PgdA/CDA1 family)